MHQAWVVLNPNDERYMDARECEALLLQFGEDKDETERRVKATVNLIFAAHCFVMMRNLTLIGMGGAV